MKALSLWQPWASLIMAGCKHYEFRKWPAPDWMVYQRFVVHASARPVRNAEIAELLNDPARLLGSLGGTDRHLGEALSLLERVWKCEEQLPLGAGLGTAILGTPVRALDLFAGRIDPDDIDPNIWAWPVSSIHSFSGPVRATGRQRFWNWPVAGAEP